MNPGLLVALAGWLFPAAVPIPPPAFLAFPRATPLDAQCDGQPDQTSCEDGSSCTLFDTCQGGVCATGFIDPDCWTVDICFQVWCDTSPGGYCRGAPLDCGDGNPCTVDVCFSQAGCYSQPISSWEPSYLRFVDKSMLRWGWPEVDPPGVAYDVVRGSRFGVGSFPAEEECLAYGGIATSLTDDSIPEWNELRWYLVRGRNTCGGGSWGQARVGATDHPRTTSTCSP